MGNSMSGILAILFMDTLEKQTLRNLTNIGLYKRYVDDTLILTTNEEEARAIYTSLNSAHPNIKFEIELPTPTNSISLLDFTLHIDDTGHASFDFYQKKAKAELLPNYRSALPTNVKRDILRNEMDRRIERCSSTTGVTRHLDNFKRIVRRNGYPENFIHQSTKQRKNREHKNMNKDKYMYFEFPYINDTIDRQIKKIFKEVDLPVRIFRKSRTLRNALSAKPTKEECRMRTCQLKNEQCLIKNCVYQLKCDKCHEVYIGSTTRAFHARFKEHMTSKTNSVSTHRSSCQSTFTTKILARENDPVKLRFKEALLINSNNATINSRAEREELQHLII
jgi:hypothetical protein